MSATVTVDLRTWTFSEVRPPGEGPWNDEPDKAQWVDPVTDFDCLAVRGAALGAWCGYVGVPPGHLWCGWSYKQLYPPPMVHGGLNYSAPGEPEGIGGRGICHVPEEGRPADLWWFGFHCAFADDFMPTNNFRLGSLLGEPDRAMEARRKYRTFDFVLAETMFLAAQLRIEPLRGA